MEEKVLETKNFGYKGVHNLYNKGAEEFNDYHGGFLSFGWWEKTNDYEVAAKQLVKKLGSMLNLNEDSYLLDVACGMGAEAICFHDFYKSKIQAVDVLQKHVDITNKRIINNGIEQKVSVMHATATDLPFENNSFSHLVSIEGPEHFKTREKFMHEAYRVLKPKGTMVLADFCFINPAKNMWQKLVTKAAQKFWACPNENAHSLEIYEEKLRNAGFTNISIQRVGDFTIPGYCREKLRKCKEHRKLRGTIVSYGGMVFIDGFMYLAFKKNLLDYILVYAEKPDSP